MRLVVHAAKIPEYAQSWSRERRALEGIQYVNACNDKKWIPAPDMLHAPWEAHACAQCSLIIKMQPGRSASGAAIRSRHSR